MPTHGSRTPDPVTDRGAAARAAFDRYDKWTQHWPVATGVPSVGIAPSTRSAQEGPGQGRSDQGRSGQGRSRH